MANGFKNFDYTYGVGMEFKATSAKQVKDLLKTNLDSLSKLVKDYNRVLKIDPNADLSKLFSEMQKLKGVVDGINNSDNSFAGFVDKGLLGRIASLENGLQAVSAVSNEVKANMNGLRETIISVIEPLKTSGQIKFPAKFDSLFGDVSDQTGKIKNIQNQIKTLETETEKVSTILTDIEQALEGKSSKGKGETDKNKIIAWADQYRILSEKLKQNLRPEELSQVVQEYGNAAVHLNNAMRTMKDATMQELNLTGLRSSITKDFKFIVDALDNYIVELDGKTDGLEGELEKLEAIQEKHVVKTSARNKSFGIAKNEDGSNLTLRAKIIPDTTASEWISTINATIQEIEPQLNKVHLTPTFSKSKNIAKEAEGNLAQINHTVNVDLQVTDNIEQFNQKIKNIDQSIKNARQQLEKEGNFKIRFEYEEGGKFKDVAYKIINQFKKIEANINITNGKNFLKDIAALRDKAKLELKDIPANIAVVDQDKTLSSFDTVRADIDKKIGNIGVNLNVQNMPEFMTQAAMMRQIIEQYYAENPVGAVSVPVVTDNGARNTAESKKESRDQSAKQVLIDTEAALKKQQELNSKIQQSQSILDELNKNGINSARFIQLGEWDKESASFKKNSQYIQELIVKYRELKNARMNSGGGVTSKEEVSLRSQLGAILSRQKKHIAEIIESKKSELRSVEAILEKEKQVANVKKSQKKTKTTNSSEQQNIQKLAMSAEDATKKVRSLNGTLIQQKRVLKDLEAKGIGSKSLIKLGEWDKSSNSFKKNSGEIQKLVDRYNELKKARIDAGGAGKPAVGEEASLRGKLSAILREQKKHVSEIIAQNQKELEGAKQISAAYKQANKNRTSTSKTDSTKHLDELIAKLNKAKETLKLLKSNKFDALGNTGLGDVNKSLESVGSKQTFEDLINVYNRLIAKKDELEKAGKTGSSEYIQLAKVYQGVEQQLSVIYKDQLKYTQSRIKQIEAEISKEKEVLGVKKEQTKEDMKRKASTGENKKTSASVDHTSTVKLDGATLNSLAKDSTLKSIDGKINNILTQLGNGVVINGSNISIEASNVSVSGKGASSGGSTKGTGEQEVKLSTISSYSQQLISLEERIKRTGLYADDLKQKFADLYTQLNAIKVQDDADTYKFDLDRFKEDFEQLKTYDKLYQDFIKSQAKQIQLNDQIATSNGPTAALQEQLKIEEEVSRNIETQLEKYTTLYNQRARQLAIDEAIKKANQEITKSSAMQSDKDVNKQNAELIKIVDNAQKQYNEMQYSMSNFKVPMTDSAIAKLKEYEQLLGILKQKQQEIMDNPDLLKNPDYSKSFNELLLRMQGVQNQFTTLQKSSESFLSKIKSIDDIKPLDATFDANNLAQLHNEMQAFANQTGKGTAKLIEFNDVNRTATFEIQNGKGQVQQLTIAYDEATNSLGRFASKTKESLSESQKFFNSLRHSFQNVARYIASFGSVYRLFAIIKQGVTYVREIDTALTELKKVTDETDAAYEQFLQDMSKTAGVVGSTVKDLTTMAAEWGRLGYSMEEAGKLAESTAILLNVSEFDDATKASEALISTMQAFQYTADESQHVVDILNEVGEFIAK